MTSLMLFFRHFCKFMLAVVLMLLMTALCPIAAVAIFIACVWYGVDNEKKKS